MTQLQPFHMVSPSPWPIVVSISALGSTISAVSMTLLGSSMFYSLSSLLFATLMWFRDIVREATFQGNHTYFTQLNLRTGMILFITSEVLLFFSLFWAYLHSALSIPYSSGNIWPLSGVASISPFELPLLNTVILLSSGVTITWAHHSMIRSYHYSSIIGLGTTLLLGCYFLLIQSAEYCLAPFTLCDGTYGSTFFMTTSAHGLHVIIGSILLMISLIRCFSAHFVPSHHFGFEASAWYWHFVDVVWLFLFFLFYWWGTYRPQIYP